MNTDGWLPRDQVMKILDIRERTLKGMKHLRRAQVRLPGSSQKQTVYEPGGIERERLRRAGAEFPEVMPAPEQQETREPATADTGLAVRESAAPALLAKLLEGLQGVQSGRAGGVPIEHKLRLSMKEAVALGFSRDQLKELIQKKKLANVGTPARYRFRRRDLEAL